MGNKQQSNNNSAVPPHWPQMIPEQSNLQSIDEQNSFHDVTEEIYPDDSASGIHPHYYPQRTHEEEEEEKQSVLPPHNPTPKSNKIDIDHDIEMPSLEVVQKNRHTALYLFDNSEPHPRIRILAHEPNVVFIRTMSKNGIAYSDQYITYNIQSFNEDISRIKSILETNKYVRLILPLSGFGIGSALCLNAPDTYSAFKTVMENFFIANSVSKASILKWNDWEMRCKAFHEELTPELHQIHEKMAHEIEKKKAHWKLKAHLAYKKQQKQISNARRRNNAQLRDQQRTLRIQRAKEQQLQQQHLDMRRHNELLKIRKAIERQHEERDKELDARLYLLNQRMEKHRETIRKSIAIKDVEQSTHTILKDYTETINHGVGYQNIYDISKLEQIVSPKIEAMNAMQNTASNNDDNDVIDFWDKMKKIDDDMQEMNTQLSVLRNL